MEQALQKFLPDGTVSGGLPIEKDEKVISFPGHRENSLVQSVGRMALTGYSCQEIAYILQRPVEQIESMYQDPAIQELFAREIEAKGKFVLKKLVSGAAVDVVCMLRNIVTNPAVKPGDRIAAGKELLDRGFGRPAPATKQNQDDDEGFVGAHPEEHLAKLRAELDARLARRKEQTK